MTKNDNELIILNFNHKLYNTSKIFGGIIVFLIFIISVITYALINVENEFLFLVIFSYPIIISIYVYNSWIKNRVFQEIALLRVAENHLLIIDKLNHIIKYDKENTHSVNFSYKGDNYWYRRKRYKIDKMSAKEYSKSLDFININGSHFFIKIVSQTDKNYFFSILDWAKNNEISFKIIQNIEA